MFGWDYYKNLLRGEYTRFLIKTLSKNEESYLDILTTGVTDILDASIEYTILHEEELHSLDDDLEFGRFGDVYYDKFTEQVLMSMLLMKRRLGVRPLRKFYRSGSRIAYDELGVKESFYNSDQQALNNLEDYVGGVVDSINNEYCIGVKKVLYDNRYEDITKINEELIGLADTPISSHISINNRCLFTVKTEYARAVNTGLLQTYRNFGVRECDWVTSGLRNVCDKCLYLEENSPYSIEEIEGLLPCHVNCYMPDTQVFTSNGWKYFYELNRDDKILSLNPSNLLTEFIDYNRIVKTKNIFGYMYHIHNRWFDICVTPNHNCFVMQRVMKNGERINSPQFRLPANLNTESKFLRKIHNDKESPKYVEINGLQFLVEDYVFFMAWYLSEGSVLHNIDDVKKRKYPVYISQQKKDTHELLKNELKRICEYLGITIYCGKRTFEIHSKELYEYLAPLGYSNEKYIPKELFNLSRVDLRKFFEYYLLGDGHIQLKSNSLVQRSFSKHLFTTSTKLVDGLSYLSLLAGYYPSISVHTKKGNLVEHHNGRYVQNYDVYRISLNSSEYAHYNTCEVDKIDYDGLVYCVELPKYHTLWVRRNGKTSWNGNCVCSVKCRVPVNPSFQGDVGFVDLTPKK